MESKRQRGRKEVRKNGIGEERKEKKKREKKKHYRSRQFFSHQNVDSKHIPKEGGSK